MNEPRDTPVTALSDDELDQVSGGGDLEDATAAMFSNQEFNAAQASVAAARG